MRKEWNFNLSGHTVRITNSWFFGMKLYIDGDVRDEDRGFLALGNEVRLSARIPEVGVLEVEPRAFITVEIDVYLKEDGNRNLVFSSTKRLALSQQRQTR